LLGYASHGGVWRQETVHVTSAADLIPVVAQALWRQTERAIHQGLLPGYVTVEESSLVLRGRLRESEQLQRHHGLLLPLEIRHWQPTRLNARYHVALRLAELVLRATSADHDSGGVLLNGFLLDMPKLF